MIRFILSIIFAVSISGIANATHIIGGYMTYGNTIGNNYLIELVVYRDCYSGVPPFDDPATIAQYDGSGNLINTHTVYVSDSGYVINSNMCTPPNICIVKARYLFNVVIPSGTTSTFTYQRCCRSLSIVNLIDPGNVGDDFYLHD